jgi:hypothetical protein
MPKQAKRRFVGLDTEEVSLVDTPANEVEFLVVKNTEDPSMGATAKKEVVPVETETDSGDVTKALAHVNGIVEKIAGIVGTKKEAKPPVGEEPATSDADGDTDDDADGDTDPPTEADPPAADTTKSIKSVLEKCGLDASTMKTVMSKLKKAGFSGGAPPFGKKPKADDDEEDDDDKKKKTKKSADDEPLTMTSLASAVHKAAAFTPARIKALQDAQDILKLVLEAVAPGDSPKSTVAPVQTHGNPSSVTELTAPNKKPTMSGTTKSADGGDELVTTLKSLADAVGGLLTRVEAIEKARPASNSADAQGATDTGTKKSSSIWSGVL